MRQYSVPDISTVLVVGALWLLGLAAAAFYSVATGTSPVSGVLVGGFLLGMATAMLATARKLVGVEERIADAVTRQAPLREHRGSRAA